jgi:molybdopterin-guanine dinucleotide biosynthesis protein A
MPAHAGIHDFLAFRKPMTDACPALILAGGGGTRLGGVDKAFLPLNGQPLITHLLRRLTPQTGKIAISANGDPARFSAFNLPVLPDGALAGKGPLAGVAAGLAWAQSVGAAELLTIPVDTPFIPNNLLEFLTPAPAVAIWQGRQHHLVATWRVADLPQILAFLDAPGAYKVRDALTFCSARRIGFDGETDPFLNINTPEDLAAAEVTPG